VNTASGRVDVSSILYVIATVSAQQARKSVPAVVEGAEPLFRPEAFVGVAPMNGKASVAISPSEGSACVVGANVARELNAREDVQLTFTFQDRREKCQIASFRRVGGPEDDHVEIGLRSAQRLADLPGRVSALRLVVPGTPSEIQSYIVDLQRMLPDADVRPIRQFTDAQAKIYSRISGLLSFTVGIVLLLTGLCVMAAMTNVAMERKNDVGLMKAIGGATRRVLRLFIAEAVLLGLAGGVIGAAAGIVLSIWLGKQVFGVAAQPRLIVYPVCVALTILVAILSAYPLRRLASIRPASVFRGEA
jgi:putative ABC transport system permease protein